MKRTLVALLLAFTSVASFAADALTDTWELYQDIVGNVSTSTVVLHQDGDRLWGHIKMSDTKNAPISGKITEGRIRWQYPAEWDGQALTMVYAASIDADGNLVGTVEVQPLGVTGEFKAKRVRQDDNSAPAATGSPAP